MVIRANIYLRTAERVLIVLGSFSGPDLHRAV